MQDIDLIEFFKLIWRSKWVIFLGAFLGFSSALIYNFKAPELYSAEASFFLPSESNAKMGGVGQLFSAQSGVSVRELLPALSESRKLKIMIAKDLMPVLHTASISQTLSYLNLSSVKLSLQKSIYQLNYESPSPKISVLVLESFIHNIEMLNQELDIAPQKILITVIDGPVEPKKPIKPRKAFNVFVGTLGGFSIGLMIALFLNIRRIISPVE